jgi:hypothetical protein
VFGPEQRGEPVQLPRGGADSVSEQRPRYQALAAAGEHQHVAAQVGGDLFQVVDRPALLLAGEVGFGHDPAQPGVPLRPAGKRKQVRPDRVRFAVLWRRQIERELRPENGG